MVVVNKWKNLKLNINMIKNANINRETKTVKKNGNSETSDYNTISKLSLDPLNIKFN